MYYDVINEIKSSKLRVDKFKLTISLYEQKHKEI